MQHDLRRRIEGGLSLLEVSLALCLSALLVVGAAWYVSNALGHTKLRDSAQVMTDWAPVATAYMAKNRRVWVGEANLRHPGTPADGTLYQPADIRTADLVAARVAPSSLTQTLPGGQRLLLRVQLRYWAASPEKWQAEALMFSQGPQFTDEALAQLSPLLGARGGMVTQSNPRVIQGRKGGWRGTVSSWGGGTLRPGQAVMLLGAGMDGSGAASGQGAFSSGKWIARKYLPGRADLNTMQSDLIVSDDAEAGQSCQPPVRLNGQKVGSKKLLVCQQTTRGWMWQSIRDLVRFNSFNVINVAGGTEFTEVAQRDMYLVATASDSHEANDGCAVGIFKISGGMTQLDVNKIKHGSISKPVLADRCTASAYISKGWKYKVQMSMDGWSRGRGDGYVVQYSHQD